MSAPAPRTNTFISSTANAISTILASNLIIISAVSFGIDILRRVFPQIYQAQDLQHGTYSEKENSLESWFDRREPTAWGRIKGWVSHLWVVEVSRLSTVDFAERAGFQCYPYFKWQRFIIKQLLIFTVGSLLVLVPINVFADPAPRTDTEKHIPLFLLTATSRVRKGSPWLWVHIALLALYSLYFCVAYTRFLQTHVSLVQSLMRRPLIQSRSVLIRNLPPEISTRGALEEMLVMAVPRIRRVCPVPPHSRRLMRAYGRYRKLRSRILAVEPRYFERGSTWLQWQGSKPRVIDSKGALVRLRYPGRWASANARLSSGLEWDPASPISAESTELPTFVSAVATLVDQESPYSVALHRRQVLVVGSVVDERTQGFVWPHRRAPKEMRQLQSLSFRHRAETMERLRTELSLAHTDFFLPSAQIGSLAFVIFEDPATARSCSQALFFPDSTRPQLEPAPSPDDIIWKNASHADKPLTLRGVYFAGVVFLLLLTYLLPVSAINIFFASGTWQVSAGGFDWLNQVLAAIPERLRPLIAGYAPSLMLSLLMALLPLIARAICQAMSPLTQSTLTYWSGTIIWLFLGWSIILNSLIVNVGSEILKLFAGSGSEALAGLLSLVNPPMAAALANNANIFATYILQRHLLGPALQLLRVGDLRLLITDIRVEKRQYRFIKAQRQRLELEIARTKEKARRQLAQCQSELRAQTRPPVLEAPSTETSSPLSSAVFQDATSDELSPPPTDSCPGPGPEIYETLLRIREYQKELDSLETSLSMSREAKQRVFTERFGVEGGTKPYDIASAVATDAFVTAVASIYCVFAPLLAPLVVLIFAVRTCVDRWLLYHTTPPLPDPLPQYDIIVAGTRWLVVGMVFGSVMSAFYFATQGSLYMGQASIAIGTLVTIYAIGLNARYRASLRHRALRLPTHFQSQGVRDIVRHAFTRSRPVRHDEDLARRTDYEFPAWAAVL